MLKSYFQWTNSKNKTIILGILGLCLITAAAFVFPKCFFAYYDARRGDSIAYLESDVSAYRVQYDSLSEKLHVISSCYENKTSMNLFCVQEEADAETKELLHSKLKSEFSHWLEIGMEISDIMVFLDKARMTDSQLYTAYPAEDTKEQTGITYWKLGYEDAEGSELFVLMDAEFQKLYSIKLSIGFMEMEGLRELDEILPLNANAAADSLYNEYSDHILYFFIRYCELEGEYYPFIISLEENSSESPMFFGGRIANEKEGELYFPIGVWYTVDEDKGLYLNMGIYPQLGNFLQL